jgi:hypothetical protein
MINDVPILIETLSRPFFSMVRCLYLTIEFDTPDHQWTLGIVGQEFPFLLLGLTGVVQAPPGRARFDDQRLIGDFINEVETARGLVNFEDIWMPQELFSADIEVGEVYRVGIDLFRAAFAFRDSRILEEDFTFRSRELRGQIESSPVESRAFRVWSAETIEHIARQGPKNLELQLERRREREA